ncbi:hypothetical protein N7513_006868 [Penicillium frequentans]|nr:hypothetical protein N7513_006868 [Penicillium glabrum]
MAKPRVVNNKRSRPLASNLYVLIENPSRANNARTSTPTPNPIPSKSTPKRPAPKRRCLGKTDTQEKENVRGICNASDEIDPRASAQAESTTVPEAYTSSDETILDQDPWDGIIDSVDGFEAEMLDQPNGRFGSTVPETCPNSENESSEWEPQWDGFEEDQDILNLEHDQRNEGLQDSSAGCVSRNEALQDPDAEEDQRNETLQDSDADCVSRNEALQDPDFFDLDTESDDEALQDSDADCVSRNEALQDPAFFDLDTESDDETLQDSEAECVSRNDALKGSDVEWYTESEDDSDDDFEYFDDEIVDEVLDDAEYPGTEAESPDDFIKDERLEEAELLKPYQEATNKPSNIPKAQSRLATYFRGIIEILRARAMVSKDEDAMVFSVQGRLKKHSVDEMFDIYFSGVSPGWNDLFERDPHTWTEKDFLDGKLCRASDDKEEQQGVYVDILSSKDSRELIGAYVGSSKKMSRRIKEHRDIADRLNRGMAKSYERSVYYAMLRKKEVEAHDFVFAQFPNRLPPAYLVTLEGIVTLLFGTIRKFQEGSGYNSLSVWDLLQQVRKDIGLAQQGWEGLNRAFPLLQGYQGNRKLPKNCTCVNPKCTLSRDGMKFTRVRPEWEDVFPSGYLCSACYQWAIHHPNKKDGRKHSLVPMFAECVIITHVVTMERPESCSQDPERCEWVRKSVPILIVAQQQV